MVTLAGFVMAPEDAPQIMAIDPDDYCAKHVKAWR
jgi:hypothetical protein